MRSIISALAAPFVLFAGSALAAPYSAVASWYGPYYHGRTTASGEVFNQYALTAAHKTLPFGTRVKVTNTSTGQTVTVRINDRGPFIGNREYDLSRAAADAVGLTASGVRTLQFEIL